MSDGRSQPILGRNNFDLIRFVLASLVVFSHAYPLATGTEADEPLALLTGHQLTFGAFAVNGFFILSGFLITQSWLSRPVARAFLEKRVRRIYPGFVVASVVSTLVVWPLFTPAGTTAFTPDFLATFIVRTARLLGHDPGGAFPGNPAPGAVNGSLWSIAYEAWCYVGVLVTGLYGALRSRRVLWIATTLAIANSLVWVVFDIHRSGAILGQIFGYPPFWARLLPYFLIGMAFNASRDCIPLNWRGASLAVLTLVIGSQVPHGLIVVLPPAAAYLLFWLAILPIPAVSRFAKHGDFSYGLYLYSFPILQIVAHYTGRTDPLWLFALAWPLSLLAAFASWYLVERRFLNSFGTAHERRREPASTFRS